MQSEMDVALARCWPGVGRGVTVGGRVGPADADLDYRQFAKCPRSIFVAAAGFFVARSIASIRSIPCRAGK
jgi:hypothetical protein